MLKFGHSKGSHACTILTPISLSLPLFQRHQVYTCQCILMLSFYPSIQEYISAQMSLYRYFSADGMAKRVEYYSWAFHSWLWWGRGVTCYRVWNCTVHFNPSDSIFNGHYLKQNLNRQNPPKGLTSAEKVLSRYICIIWHCFEHNMQVSSGFEELCQYIRGNEAKFIGTAP